jgi:broad specificity phosphatase PhoE
MSLIYARHGETKLNGKAGGSEERLRGWLPVDLTPKGQDQAHALAQTLKGVNHASFHSSDLPRAIQTASIISKHVGRDHAPTNALRDWHTGDLAGQKFADVKDHLHYLIDHPEESAPNGEPLNSYLSRFVPFVKELVESPDTHLVVGHARGTQVLKALADNNGKWISGETLKDKPVTEPGQSIMIARDWTMTPDHKS